jgi:signal transduction histidine kinase/CheY-like chemotaxis protein
MKIERHASVNWIQVIKANISQVCFVFAAFFLMVLVSYLSISSIVRNRLVIGTDEVMLATEANVRAGFTEAEATMTNAVNIVQGMMDRGASQEELLTYLTNMTEWIRKDNEWVMGIYGIYGYLHGELVDSMALNPGPEYRMQTRPWFDAAVRNPGRKTVYTEPYLDYRTGNVIMSAVHNVYGKAGDNYGFLVIDIDLSWLKGHSRSFQGSDGKYNIIMNQYMVVVGHPKDEIVGRPLREACDGYRLLHDALIRHREISTMRITDIDGNDAIVSFKRMFNGWYIGVLMAYSSYYRDVYYTAGILSALGFVFMFVLSFLLLRLSAARMRSDEENRGKTTFLARMSHEIRTPMNAVIGLSELGLRLDVPPLAAEYFTGIHQAGQNLLSIINDILDFSKIASANMEINPSHYMLASLLNDVINITRVRLKEKPITFIVDVEPTIPGSLIGDEARVRQVLLNLLSNAVKYTSNGFVRFSVTGERMGSDSILLKFQVSDSGIGIKPQDMKKLFGDFVRLDAAHNKGAEGTGLGLAIARKLCQIMGGGITVSSVYGEGSEFTAVIPQEVEGDTPLAAVKDAVEKSVLSYDAHPLRAESIYTALLGLGVDAVMAEDEEDFLRKLERGWYAFAFACPQTAGRARRVISRENLKTSLVLLVDFWEMASFQNVPTVVMPAYAVPLANALNYENETPAVGKSGRSRVSFTAPDVRVLVVDDMPVNLVVTKRMLAPYMMRVDTCGSGEEAVALAKENEYDMILMDHMMPGMDGVEATEVLRGTEHGLKIPIIALTANAVSGMREMFLQHGMNDFLSKPVDPAKLDAVLRKWAPKECRRPAVSCETPRETASFEIEGLDVKKGMAMAGGTEAKYREVLEVYRRDSEARIEFLNGEHAAKDMGNFITQVHSLKGAAASVGAEALAAEAARLEAAGRNGDMEFIREQIDGFRENLSGLIGRISTAPAAKSAGKSLDGETTSLRQRLKELKDAFLSEDVRKADAILAELSMMPLGSETARAVSEISEMVLTSDFIEAAAKLDELSKLDSISS